MDECCDDRKRLILILMMMMMNHDGEQDSDVMTMTIQYTPIYIGKYQGADFPTKLE